MATTRNDISDSPEDQKRLKPDTANLDLPDVNDIPGQEHVHVPSLGELADTTISSADEEGSRILDDDKTDADVTEDEIELLRTSAESMSSNDDINLRHSMPDDKDLDGEALNEAVDLSGKDLDVPGEEQDDANEEIGEEDEENNEYSLGGDNHDDI